MIVRDQSRRPRSMCTNRDCDDSFVGVRVVGGCSTCGVALSPYRSARDMLADAPGWHSFLDVAREVLAERGVRMPVTDAEWDLTAPTIVSLVGHERTSALLIGNEVRLASPSPFPLSPSTEPERFA